MRRSSVVVMAVVVILGGALGAYASFQLEYAAVQPGGCPSNYHGSAPMRTTLGHSTTGHLTEFNLPEPSRAPNAIATAPDGSVWFGEESLPALAHLFQNGTLLEYVWPGSYPPKGTIDYSCAYRTQIWGVALWNGTVWATDTSGNQLVSLNPATGYVHLYTLAANAFPDYLVAGLDGRLWLTELTVPAIVSLDKNGTSHTYTLPTGIQGTPTQVSFVNSSYALYDDAGEAGASNGGVYSFDPSHPAFTRVAGNRSLTGLTGLAAASRGLWVSQHGPPFISFYNSSSSTWTDFPTSLVPYADTTLPYFIQSDGTRIWFNEHYGDRIAEINPSSRSMVEYAISDPPVENLSGISNTQTIARDGGRIWFAEFSGNRVGFADFSSPPPFTLTLLSSHEVSVAPGGSVALSVGLQGSSASPVQLSFSDSEQASGVPKGLNASSAEHVFPMLSQGVSFTVNIAADSRLAPGVYTFDVTATNGSVSLTSFIQVQVL